MVGGQMLDLAAEGRFAQGASNKLTERDVAVLQAMKTGALLRFACNAGATKSVPPPGATPTRKRIGLTG